MDKFPLLWEGKPSGELVTEREALYTWFTARCKRPREGIWCAWVIGNRGELRIGVLEPMGNQAVIRRRFSDRMTQPLGKIVRGEIRSASAETVDWEAITEPGQLFRTPWLRRQLRGMGGTLTRKEGGKRFLALPYDQKSHFPLPALFCFAHIKYIREQSYVVYVFDDKEWPLF